MEKSYKLISNGKDKQIAYPLGMSDQLIEALEAARKNRSFKRWCLSTIWL